MQRNIVSQTLTQLSEENTKKRLREESGQKDDTNKRLKSEIIQLKRKVRAKNTVIIHLRSELAKTKKRLFFSTPIPQNKITLLTDEGFFLVHQAFINCNQRLKLPIGYQEIINTILHILLVQGKNEVNVSLITAENNGFKNYSVTVCLRTLTKAGFLKDSAPHNKLKEYQFNLEYLKYINTPENVSIHLPEDEAGPFLLNEIGYKAIQKAYQCDHPYYQYSLSSREIIEKILAYLLN